MVTGARAGTGPAVDRPMTATEAIVARVWAVELRLPRVGLDEDFIDLGSHSLQGLAIAARLETTFGVAVPARILFEEPTVADLAAWIDRRRDDAPAAETPVRLHGHDESGLRPVFAVPGGRGDPRQLYGLAKLARDSDARRPVWAFPGDPAAPTQAPPEEWVPTAAAILNATLRALQPAGPYLLLGVCVGGLFAWEMARQLEDEGETAQLFLVDTRNPRLEIGPGTFRQAVSAALTREERRARRGERRAWRDRQGEDDSGDDDDDDGETGARRIMMTKSYAPPPIAAAVTLLVNQHWHRVSADLGWTELLGDRPRVIVTAGGHGPEWNGAQVSAAFRDWLHEVDPAADEGGVPMAEVIGPGARGRA